MLLSLCIFSKVELLTSFKLRVTSSYLSLRHVFDNNTHMWEPFVMHSTFSHGVLSRKSVAEKYKRELDICIAALKDTRRRRGIKIIPGGDYGY